MELVAGLDATWWLLLFGVGLTAGFLSGIVGMGGALLLVPALAFVGGMPFKLATGVASLHGLAVGLFSYLVHGRYGAVDGRIGVVAGFASVLGGLAGAAVSGAVDALAVKLIYLAAALLSLVLLLVPVRVPPGRQSVHVARSDLKATLFGAFTGVVAGNIGAGGTFMLVPLFRTTLLMPIHRAIGTGMLVSIFTAVSAMAGKAALGQIPWMEAAIVVTGSALGSFMGARLTRRIPGRPLRWLLIGMLALLLARTAADLITGAS